MLTQYANGARDPPRRMEELSVLVAWRLDPPPAATHARSKAGPPPLARGSSVLDDEDAIWAADDMDDA